jgi:hypothetical protein
VLLIEPPCGHCPNASGLSWSLLDQSVEETLIDEPALLRQQYEPEAHFVEGTDVPGNA